MLIFESKFLRLFVYIYVCLLVYNWMRDMKGEFRFIIKMMIFYVFMFYNGNLYFFEVGKVDDNNYYC